MFFVRLEAPVFRPGLRSPSHRAEAVWILGERGRVAREHGAWAMRASCPAMAQAESPAAEHDGTLEPGRGECR